MTEYDKRNLGLGFAVGVCTVIALLAISLEPYDNPRAEAYKACINAEIGKREFISLERECTWRVYEQ